MVEKISTAVSPRPRRFQGSILRCALLRTSLEPLPGGLLHHVPRRPAFFFRRVPDVRDDLRIHHRQKLNPPGRRRAHSSLRQFGLDRHRPVPRHDSVGLTIRQVLVSRAAARRLSPAKIVPLIYNAKFASPRQTPRDSNGRGVRSRSRQSTRKHEVRRQLHGDRLRHPVAKAWQVDACEQGFTTA